MDALTPQERNVLRLLCSAKGTKEIAAELGIARATAATYTKRIAAKLGARNRVHAVLIAYGLEGQEPALCRFPSAAHGTRPAT